MSGSDAGQCPTTHTTCLSRGCTKKPAPPQRWDDWHVAWCRSPLTFAAMCRPSISFAIMGIQLTTCFRKHKSILSGLWGKTDFVVSPEYWPRHGNDNWDKTGVGNWWNQEISLASNLSETIFYHPSHWSTTRNNYHNPPDWKQSPSEKRQHIFSTILFLLSTHKTFYM